MTPAESIRHLKNKEFPIDVCAGIGGLADLAYSCIEARIEKRLDLGLPPNKDDLDAAKVLIEVFPYFPPINTEPRHK